MPWCAFPFQQICHCKNLSSSAEMSVPKIGYTPQPQNCQFRKSTLIITWIWGYPKFGQNQMSAASHPSERTMVCNGMSTYFEPTHADFYLEFFQPWTSISDWGYFMILPNNIKKYHQVLVMPLFFHHPKGLIDLGFVFHLHHVNLPVHRRRCAELPAGRQRLAHPRGAERRAGAGRHRREELWQSRGRGQVLGMEVHGSSSWG